MDLVGTEVGLLRRLRKKRPDKQFVPLKDYAICDAMKSITLAELYRALRDDVFSVTVPDPTVSRARAAIRAMMALT